jgi:VanZ family protein
MRRTLAIAWSLAILVACSIPGDDLPNVDLPLGPDKWVHAGLFFVLGALWLWAGARPRTVLLGGLAFAVGTELWQTALPIGRSGDPYDALADAAGLLLALGLWTYRQRRSNDRAPVGS